MSTTIAPGATFRLPVGALRALRNAARAAGASPPALLRELGAACAAELADGLRSHIAEQGAEADPEKLDSERFWELLAGYLAELGWGRLQVAHPHPAVVRLSAAEWMESEPGAGRHPSCHFTTGMLSALFTAVAGAELAALEVECRSAGGARCAWMVGGMEALGKVYEALRDGRDPEQALQEMS